MKQTIFGRALEPLLSIPKEPPTCSIAAIKKLGSRLKLSPAIEIFCAESDRFTIVAHEISKALRSKLDVQFPEMVWTSNGSVIEADVRFSGDILSTVKSLAKRAASVTLHDHQYEVLSLSGCQYSIAEFGQLEGHVVFFLKLAPDDKHGFRTANKIADMLPKQSWVLVYTNQFKWFLVSVLQRRVLKEALEICEGHGAIRKYSGFELNLRPVPLIYSTDSGAGLMLFDFHCTQHWLLLFLSDSVGSLRLHACRLCLHLDRHGKSRMLALAELIGLTAIEKEGLVHFDAGLRP